MRIGFIADKVPYAAPRGWGVYSRELLRALLELDRANTYHCFYSFLRKGDTDRVLGGARVGLQNHVWRLPGRFMDLVWDHWRLLPVELFIGDVDVVHVPYELLPPVKSAKTVVTVHDVTFLRHPELLEPSFVERYRRRIKRVVAGADRIVTDSHNTMEDLVELTPAERERITVIPLGVNDRFRPLAAKNDATQVLRRLGVAPPYVLFVGAADEDKNLRRLAAACRRLRRKIPLLTLVLAGRDHWGYARLMDELRASNDDEGIVLTGFVADADLPYLYSGAEALALPSLHEGFGLPALEAMACGTPVLASNVASLPEVVGDAGVLVDPHSVEPIEEGLSRLLLDRDVRAACVAKGLERSAAYSWRATAQRTLQVYEELAP